MRRALAGAAAGLARRRTFAADAAAASSSAAAAPALHPLPPPTPPDPPTTSPRRGEDAASRPERPRYVSRKFSARIGLPPPRTGKAWERRPDPANERGEPGRAGRLFRGLVAALEAGEPPPPLPDGKDPLRPFLVSRRMAAAPSADAARDLMGLAYAAGTLPDPRHFSYLASRYGNEARPDAVRSVMADAVRAGFKERPQWYTSLIAAHGRTGDVNGARAAHREMDARLGGSDERSVVALINTLGVAGRAAEAVETVAALRAQRAAEVAARARARAREQGEGEGEGSGLSATSPTPTRRPRPAPLSLATYTALLLAHAEVRDVTGARATLASAAADGVSLDAVRPQQALLRLWVRAGDEARARGALVAMAAAGASPAHLEQGWALLADLAGQGGGPDAVHGVLAEADAAGVPPSSACFTVLLNARAAAGDAAGADAAAAEMRARGVPLSRFTYGSLIRWHARRGDLASAEAVHRAQAADPCAGADPVSDAALVEAACQAWWAGGRARPALLDAAWETALQLGVIDPSRLFKRAGGREGAGVEHPWAAAAAWRRRRAGGGGGGAGAPAPRPGPARPHPPSPPPSHFPSFDFRPPSARFILVDLHYMSPWVAQLALLAALDRLLVAGWRGGRAFVGEGRGGEGRARRGARPPPRLGGDAPSPPPPPPPLPPPDIHFITGIGRRSKARGTSAVRHAVIRLLHNLGLPVRLGVANEGLVVLAGRDVGALFGGCDAGPRRRLLPSHCGDVIVEAPNV